MSRKNAGGHADNSPNELEHVDPYHCEASHTPFHHWIRSAITGRAEFCLHCGAPASDVEVSP